MVTEGRELVPIARTFRGLADGKAKKHFGEDPFQGVATPCDGRKMAQLGRLGALLIAVAAVEAFAPPCEPNPSRRLARTGSPLQVGSEQRRLRTEAYRTFCNDAGLAPRHDVIARRMRTTLHAMSLPREGLGDSLHDRMSLNAPEIVKGHGEHRFRPKIAGLIRDLSRKICAGVCEFSSSYPWHLCRPGGTVAHC